MLGHDLRRSQAVGHQVHHVRDRDAQPAQRRAAREHLWIMRDAVEQVFRPSEAERPGAAARIERGPTDYECAPGRRTAQFYVKIRRIRTSGVEADGPEQYEQKRAKKAQAAERGTVGSPFLDRRLSG
jgi:hypothetical protein